MTRTSASFDINKKNWPNNHTFPDMIYIDTCSVMDMVLQRQHGQLTEDYISELIKRDGMITWSQHTIDEITQLIHVDQYFKLAKSKKIKPIKNKGIWKLAEDTATDVESSSIAQIVVSEVDNITTLLEQFGSQTTVSDNDVNLLTKNIYSSYGGNQQDSKHFAIANLTGVNNILTQDSGFLRYPTVNIFGSSNQIVQNYNVNQNPVIYTDYKKLLITDSKDENVS